MHRKFSSLDNAYYDVKIIFCYGFILRTLLKFEISLKIKYLFIDNTKNDSIRMEHDAIFEFMM